MSDYIETRIFGPPGTGKTTSLSGLIATACRDFGSEAVLVSSFTKAAARELVGRQLPLNDDQVGTLHALCYRALDRPKLVTSALLKDWNAEHPTKAFGGIGTDIDDPYGSIESDSAGQGDELLQELNRLRGLRVEESLWPIRIQSFAEEWKDFKSNTWTMDFTDLIERCVEDRLPIPHAARVLFLDEVQDFSPLELRLARWWGSQCDQLYLAGDDDQCLYRFKGSTPDAFLSPELPAEQVRILGQSYRVPRAVHEAAVRWVEQIETRMPKEYKPRDFEGEVGQIPMSYQYPAWIQDRLMEWIDRGKTVAFLASCSYFLEPLKKQLREWGVPFHNPYRLKRGDWNPLGHKSFRGTEAKATCLSSDRILAYKRPSLPPDHRLAGWWTYKDLWDWAGILEAEGLFRHGAKTEMRRKAEHRDTGGLAVDADDLEKWICDPVAAEKATAGDLEWYRGKFLKSHDKPMQYACNVLERRGIEGLEKKPQVIIGTIHSVKGGEADCSPGDELVLTTKRGLVPIGDLDPVRDRLVSFNSDHHKIHRGGPCRPDGYAFTRASRPYNGDILTIETNASCTRVTPNHHLTVRWNRESLGAYCVYLMRRGAWWRIGVTQLHYAMRGQSGVLGRMRREGATEAWVLGVFTAQREALYYEQLWSHSFGVPDLNFVCEARNANQIGTDGLQEIWNAIDSEPGAKRLLSARGLSPQWPLWSFYGEGRRIRQSGIRNRWTVRAANLIPGYMEIPTDPGKGQNPEWRQFSISKAPFSGDVYSLDVERWHHYVSGGAVVHNCVVLFPDLSAAGFREWYTPGEARDSVRRCFYVGMTRAKEELYWAQPVGMSISGYL